MSVELDFDTGPALPARVIALGAIALLIGLVFGYAASQAMFTNQLDNKRIDDATAVHKAVKEKVTLFDEVKDDIFKLNPNKPDFEAVKKLAEVEIELGGVSLGDATLFDPVAIDNITSYAADSQALRKALRDHNRLTQKDKAEIDELMKENEVLEKNNYFGVRFDYRHALKNGGDENYIPRPGRLVISHGADKEEKGKVKVEDPASGKEASVEIQGFIPIDKSQILKSSGGNALTRYGYRVKELKFRTEKLAKQTETTVTSLENLISDDGAAPAPAPAAPKEEAAAAE